MKLWSRLSYLTEVERYCANAFHVGSPVAGARASTTVLASRIKPTSPASTYIHTYARKSLAVRTSKLENASASHYESNRAHVAVSRLRILLCHA